MIRFCQQNEDLLSHIANLCGQLDAHFNRFKDRVSLMTAADCYEMNRMLAECGITHSKLRDGLQLEDDSFTRRLEAAETAFKTGKDAAERQYAADRKRLEVQCDSKLRQVSDRLDSDFKQIAQSMGQFSEKYRNFNVTMFDVTSPAQFRNFSRTTPGQSGSFSTALARVNNLTLKRDQSGLLLTKTGIWISIGAIILGVFLFGSRYGGGTGVFWGVIIAASVFGGLAYFSSRARDALEMLNAGVAIQLRDFVQRHDKEADDARKALAAAVSPARGQCDVQTAQLQRDRAATINRVQQDRDQTLREFVARVGRTDAALLSRVRRSEKLAADWVASHVQLAGSIDQKRGALANAATRFPDPAPQLIRLGEVSIA